MYSCGFYKKALFLHGFFKSVQNGEADFVNSQSNNG